MAKIYGQLERAQLEVLSSTPAAGVSGRVVWQSTLGQFLLDDGTNYRNMIRNDEKAILGNDGTGANNIRLHRGAAGVLQFVPGDNADADGVLSTALNKLSFKFESYPDVSKPANGNAGRAIWNETFNALNIDNGTSWVPVGSGSGVGAYLAFYPDPGGSPVEVEDAGLVYFDFEDEEDQILWGFLKIPSGYQAGQQLKLKMDVESDETGSAQLIMQTQSYLVRAGTDAMSANSNSHTDTASYSPGAVAVTELELDLTDASGQVNGVAVSAGDILKVAISKPTDTSTENIRMFKSLVEVAT